MTELKLDTTSFDGHLQLRGSSRSSIPALRLLYRNHFRNSNKEIFNIHKYTVYRLLKTVYVSPGISELNNKSTNHQSLPISFSVVQLRRTVVTQNSIIKHKDQKTYRLWLFGSAPDQLYPKFGAWSVSHQAQWFLF